VRNQVENVPNVWYNIVMAQVFKNKEKIVSTLLGEFRKSGFAGLSLSQISKSTGLGKASLYHYFPGGKDEMALAVMEMVRAWVESEIVGVLTSDGEAKERLLLVLKRLDEFYQSGSGACLLEIMGSSSSPSSVQAEIKETFATLIRGFHKLAMDCGKSSGEAKICAENIVVGIQGSLVLARALKDPSPFQRQLKLIRQELAG
jgi:TetR/AcrR family transcriptional regulator, lmrAB and yxaGH operons repressor